MGAESPPACPGLPCLPEGVSGSAWASVPLPAICSPLCFPRGLGCGEGAGGGKVRGSREDVKSLLERPAQHVWLEGLTFLRDPGGHSLPASPASGVGNVAAESTMLRDTGDSVGSFMPTKP